jgi:hypothetical protein
MHPLIHMEGEGVTKARPQSHVESDGKDDTQ